ncbi:MAG: hypothetical protein H6907_08575 [Hyphomicrobiales bacterium]|nr:hypothetical protein [Hyphomicrobiales bacterium]MCP5371772.1 hypothetical protein [Hyphomicrobiales bacterium]
MARPWSYHRGMDALRRPLAALMFAAGTLLAAPAARADAPAPARVDLVAAETALVPGQTAWVALRQDLRPGWHTYWRNPGDAGEAALIDWRLPAGFAAGEVRWPLPERFVDGPVVSYGYGGRVLLPVAVTVPAGARAGDRVTLAATVEYVACAEICIPLTAEVALDLPVAAAADAGPAAPAIAAARAREPKPFPGTASAQVTDDWVRLRLAGLGHLAGRKPWFLGHAWGQLDPGPAAAARADGGDLVLTLARGDLKGQPLARLDGVLVWEETDGTEGAWAVSAPAAPTN